jgi:acetyl-CoA acetyltransferase
MLRAVLKDAAVIAGIAQTPFAKRLEPSEKELACQAILAALDDAGIDPGEVDGLASYTMETTDEAEIARNLGLGDDVLRPGGLRRTAPAPATLGLLAMAIATGQCRVGVAWRARSRRRRPWAGAVQASISGAFTRPFGLLRPVDEIALLTRRWMHRPAPPASTCGGRAGGARHGPANRAP